MDNTTKQWIKNWLEGLKRIEAQHKESKDGIWINSNQSVDMVLEAKNILEQILEEK